MSDEYAAGAVAGMLALLKQAKPPADPYPGVALTNVAAWYSPGYPDLRQEAEEEYHQFQAAIFDLIQVARQHTLIFAGVSDPMSAGPDYVALPPAMLREWEFDSQGTAWPRQGGGGVVFRHVRVFTPEQYAFVRKCDGRLEPMPKQGEAATAGADTAAPPTLPRRGGGRPPHSAQAEFIKEMIRFALRPDGFETRDQLAKHLSDWAKTNLLPGDPDERTMRRWIETYCPDEIPPS